MWVAEGGDGTDGAASTEDAAREVSKSQNRLTQIERRATWGGSTDGMVKSDDGLWKEGFGLRGEGRGEEGRDLIGGREGIGAPMKVANLELEVDDAILAGNGRGLFIFAAAGGLGGQFCAAGVAVLDELVLAQAKAKDDVLHHHEGEKRGGKAGACEFAKHEVGEGSGSGQEVNSRAGMPDGRGSEGFPV